MDAAEADAADSVVVSLFYNLHEVHSNNFYRITTDHRQKP
jgi:hypothetical protein